MFAELMPLVKQRVIMMTISDIGEGLLRVNIIPRKLEGGSEENAALTTPLSVTGKPDELDRDLAGQLASFTDSVVKTCSNLEELRTQHAAAVKAVEAENKKKLDEKKKTGSSKATSTETTETKAPAFKDGKPVFGSKPTAVSGDSRSLFETGSRQGEGEATEAAATDETTRPRAQHPGVSNNHSPIAPTRQSLFDTPGGEAKGVAGNGRATGVARVVEQSESESMVTSPTEADICDICKCPILSFQERHPFMPVPAHASATDCHSARRQVNR